MKWEVAAQMRDGMRVHRRFHRFVNAVWERNVMNAKTPGVTFVVINRETQEVRHQPEAP